MSRTCANLAAVLVVAVLGAAGSASASWFDPHTRQERIPLADVERPLIVGKSWLLFDFGFSWKRSDSQFTTARLFNAGFTEGDHWVREKNDAAWNYRRIDIGAQWGFSRNAELWVRLPLLWAQVWNNRMVDEDGARQPIASFGLGDLHGGFKYQWFRTQSQDGRFSNALTTGIDIRFPTGNESPGSYLPGPNNVATIVTGAGTWGYDLEVRFKQQLRILAVEAALGFTWNPTGTVMYLVDDVQNQFNQHLDPGDVVHGNVGVTVQFVKNLGLRGDLWLDYRTPTKWGSTLNSFPACKECAAIPASDGFWMDAGARLLVDVDAHFGLDFWFRGSIAGRRNFLWPLEELSPSRGITAGGNVQIRL